ncbi:hypothetical protein DPMN_133502 [Dreissena polymorpha]|uniref:Uncharacterized protein n=1 Tax=Dreissena polymorpha TaxID=45954 RepID=A0A9D4JB21_DREPO|nr:hypothetical protein DPMN_133502 [Dreissena polymorpha]
MLSVGRRRTIWRPPYVGLCPRTLITELWLCIDRRHRGSVLSPVIGQVTRDRTGHIHGTGLWGPGTGHWLVRSLVTLGTGPGTGHRSLTGPVNGHM